MEGIIFIGLVLLVVFIAGSICGIIALVRQRKLRTRLQVLENDMNRMRTRQPQAEKPTAVAVERDLASEPAAVPSQPSPEPVKPPPLPPQPPMAERQMEAPPAEKDRLSLEMKLGTRWLNWVGIVMLLVGVAFFLKYAYDNAWIGPKGRLALGTLFGISALVIGERFRRKDWDILFKVLTGGGLAAFYLCIFFSFQIYNLSTQTVSMLLAILVTGLAVVLAVGHNAMSIAVLALIGGFSSPVLLSTGENHPYALFSYIAILDLVAMGTAYFRRWRALDLFSFIGTAVLYLGWYDRFFARDQMAPALLFISLFYLMFLLIPTLHSLVRRISETREAVALIVLNAVFSFGCYYQILFLEHRYAMGFVTLGQAALVLILFQLWAHRLGRQGQTAASLLIVSLGLVTIAIPIQLKFYGIPIAWSMEGAVLTWLGIRFRHRIPRVSAMLALILAAGGLIHRLPLHKAIFTPIFNVPFGSWMVVIAMAATAAYLLHRDSASDEPWAPVLAAFAATIAFGLTCGVLTSELSQIWTINHRIAHYRTYQFSSLAILWSVIPTVTAYILLRQGAQKGMYLCWACFVFGALVFLGGLAHYRHPSAWLLVNVTFAPKLFFIIVLWWCAKLCRRRGLGLAGDILELAGHGLLALLLAFEFERWGRYSDLISPKMGTSLISAGWALQAAVVIWIGLAAQNRLLRYTGFILFGLAIAKILFIDLSEFEKVYRIVSFVASGLLLVCAGYFYQRYSATLLERSDGEVHK